ncbi:MAG: isoprenylcysteine carboxylmethyltransferase family protein [Anaerolineaceae bacterium]|nr:MAG: isoprenylcysteine carboxylmethyltransferase family protein [Anaerolineaceae bacterium]
MRNTLITIAGTILVPCIIHFLVPYLILQATSESAPSQLGLIEVGSVILAVIGISMVIWVSITFVRRGKGTAAPIVPPKEFVAIGLFRFVRNPMYVGLLLVIFAEAVFFRSAWILLYGSLLWLATHSYTVLIEEPELERRFGATYRNYRSTTPRWIPRPPRYPET